MLNKLRCHARFECPASQITWSGFLIGIHIFNDKLCRSRSVGFQPTDLDLHCLLRQGMSCSAREGLRAMITLTKLKTAEVFNFKRHKNVFYPFETQCRSISLKNTNNVCLFLSSFSLRKPLRYTVLTLEMKVQLLWKFWSANHLLHPIKIIR